MHDGKRGKPQLTCKEPLLFLPPRSRRQRRAGAVLARKPHRARVAKRIQRLEAGEERWRRRRADRHVGLPSRPAHRVQRFSKRGRRHPARPARPGPMWARWARWSARRPRWVLVPRVLHRAGRQRSQVSFDDVGISGTTTPSRWQSPSASSLIGCPAELHRRMRRVMRGGNGRFLADDLLVGFSSCRWDTGD